MKIKISNFIPLIVLGALTVTSCGNSYENYLTSIAPAGAPALAFAKKKMNGEAITFTNNTANVGSQLIVDNYGAVIFDFYDGLKSIVKSQLPGPGKKSNYRLWRIVTKGNLYILPTGSKDIDHITDKDNAIITFGGEESLPNVVFNKMYAASLEDIHITNLVNVSMIGPVIANKGLYEGNQYDYIVCAEPVLTKFSKNVTYEHQATAFTDIPAFKTVFGEGAIIPQAGLFINNEMYKAYPLYFNNWYKNFNSDVVYTAKSENAEALANSIDSHWHSKTDQINIFGFDSDIVREVQGTKDNGFAMLEDGRWVSDEHPNEGVDLATFFEKLGKAEEYETYKGFIVNPEVIIY